MATVAEKLLTAEEYRLLPDDGRKTELVRGRVVVVNMPAPRHGFVCGNVAHFLGIFVREHPLGRVLTNDSAVVTERDPDTVRGGDVEFYRYQRLPPGPLPEDYLDVVPDLIFEVRSPTDRWGEVLAKVAEYLRAGVRVVCVADPGTETVRVYRDDSPEQAVASGGELTLPDVLGDFRVPVRALFE